MALDESGDTLRQALQRIDIGTSSGESNTSEHAGDHVRLKTPRPHERARQRGINGRTAHSRSPASSGRASPTSATTISEEPPGSDDYFSPRSE